ncbi:TPA: protein disulfide oxidoreductase [Enterobacter kobei]|nr:protein disulfide oxidoreductase [Enterobacter kobei]
MRRLIRILRELLILTFIVSVTVTVVGWVRSPDVPTDVSGVQIQLLNGESSSLAKMSEEKPLLIYVWASWCGICKLTTPTVATMADEGANVLAVALQSGNDDRVRLWMSKKNMTMPGANDINGLLAKRWKVSATPTFVIIYKGKVISATSGWTSNWGLRWRLWRAKV